MSESTIVPLNEDEECVSLYNLPVEIFIYICKYLDSKTIVDSLKCVCHRFYEILSDDAVWRAWMRERWPELPTSSICYTDEIIPSHSAYIQVDRGLSLWCPKQNNFRVLEDNTTHISTVDAVKLLQGGRIGVSGARDRALAVWNTCDQLRLTEHKLSAHEGWIWALESCPESHGFYSCSWDSTVKLWSLEQGSLQQASMFKTKAAVLSLVCPPGLVGAGLYTASVELFDPRSGHISSYVCHNRAIMALCKVRNFIISASEDSTIAVWDVVAGKTFKSGIHIPSEGYPLTLSFNKGNLLFIGDTKSMLHIYDTNDDKFTLVESFDLGHKPRGTITSMWHNPGFIITGSKDSTVRIHTATRPLHLINCLKSPNNGVISLDFVDPVLFLGSGSNTVELWLPSHSETSTTNQTVHLDDVSSDF